MSPNEDPRNKYPRPPLPEQHQATQPRLTPQMHPRPDHGEDSYRGSGRLRGQRALIAGVQHRREREADMERAQILEVFETNLVAPLILMREAAPHLEPGASVIVTASIQSFDPGPDLLNYAMTKAALEAFTRALAEEQAERGVRVNAVAPRAYLNSTDPGGGIGREAAILRREHAARQARTTGRTRRRACLCRLRRGLVRLGCGAARARRSAPLK